MPTIHAICEPSSRNDTFTSNALAVEIASLPEHIRGFGHVKERHLHEATARQAELMSAYRAGAAKAPHPMAAE